MTERKSGLYTILTGMAGGAAAWTGVELVLHAAPAFPDLRTITLSLGGAAGLLLGAVVPTAEGLRQRQPGKILRAVLVGSLTGLVFGALGMAAGQLILSYIVSGAALSGSRLAVWGASLARVPGWMIVGTVVGSASGLRSRSLRRVAAGAAGGLIGGLTGGAAAEILSGVTSNLYGRGAGLMLWGLAVAVFADAMERRRARGRLTVLNGPLKGRSFPVNQAVMTIAASPSSDLTIPGESGPAGNGALVLMKKGAVVLKPTGNMKVELNGSPAGVTELRYDDIIKVGELTVIYEAKR